MNQTPKHYGGENNPFEPIKIIEHYGLNFQIGNVIKYLLRAGRKEDNAYEQDIRKAIHYLEIELAYAQNRGIPRLDKSVVEPKQNAPVFALHLASFEGDEMPSKVLLWTNDDAHATVSIGCDERNVQGFFVTYDEGLVHVWGLNFEGDDKPNPLILSLPRSSTYVYNS